MRVIFAVLLVIGICVVASPAFRNGFYDGFCGVNHETNKPTKHHWGCENLRQKAEEEKVP